MEFQVIFKDSFLKDLERLVRLIARHNPMAASNLGESLLKGGESLRFFPERFPKVRQRPEIRRFIVKKHFKVFYRVRHDSLTVEILRCWDARRESEPTL